MTISEIFSNEYLFNPTPPQTSRLYIVLLVLFGVITAASVYLMFYKGELQKITRRFAVASITSGIAGLIYLGARYEGLPWLGSRFMLALVLFTFLIWNIVNIVWLIRFLPKYFKKKQTEDRFKKYLPQKKRSK